ncbi:MAG: hypothetical protein AAF802_24505, partial [Planctomycetota bacterium]
MTANAASERRSVRIETGARLHFGLLRTQAPFGGLGMMIDCPETVIRMKQSSRFHLDAELTKRATPIVERLTQKAGLKDVPSVEVVAEQLPPAHCGFGSGTQLSLALAEGFANMFDLQLTETELALDIARRGKRSKIGTRGYFAGGLFLEHGEPATVHRVEPPTDWRILVALPNPLPSRTSGDEEASQFAALSDPEKETSNILLSIAENEILPSVAEGDFGRFADAVTRYNHESGMLFSKVQGGAYNGKDVTELIETMKENSAIGIGQSSWGPSVFAFCEDELSARKLGERLGTERADWFVAKPRNVGREIVGEA